PPSFKGGAAAVIGVLAALWLASGFYVVDAREAGVVLQLGSFNRLTEPGLQWHAPYPFEKAEIVNLTELRSVEVGYRGSAQNRVPEESLMLTEDQNIIDVQLSVQYDIKDARAFLFNNAARERDGKDLVKQAAETAIREVVGRNKVDFVLNEGRAQIAADARKLIQEVLDRYQAGIRIAKVNINDVQPPQQVLAAFDDAVKAGQDKDKLLNEGMAYANEVVPKAKGMASRLVQEAEGYQQQVVERAEGDAQRFKQVLPEYNKAPKVMRDRMYLDMMQQIMHNSSKVLVDQKGGNSLLYLPLDKL
ncbi:FtsH protease activity modulator HflK, partial [Chromobacterium piscinae]